jgi:NCS1 family nucleobase:cation symporter-1
MNRDSAREQDGQDTNAELPPSRYSNADFAPTRASERTWTTKDIAVLWISLSACVPTYMLASSLIAVGMNWWQAILTILLGNGIVLLPMVINAHAGTQYGIPYPVYCRAAFGILGANVPALLRALVACGWFGIQTWIGGFAIYMVLIVFEPSIATLATLPMLDINVAQFACFLAFWCLNMLVVRRGVESIRVLLNIKAPLLVLLGLALLAWAYQRAGGLGPMLAEPSQFGPGRPKEGQFWGCFFPSLTAMIGFWATLALNIPDFSRYARSQRDQVLGQAIGLPATMALFSFIGVAVTSATVAIFGEAIWDPVMLITKFTNPIALVIALVALSIATLATNIAANLVGPANDFVHLAPRWITFRRGGYITGVIGILIMPWKLVADPSGYIFTWLAGYSGLLGAIGGVLIGDYLVVRRTKLDLAGLYEGAGPYWYSRGYHPAAMVALVAGILPNLPGFLGTAYGLAVAQGWLELYQFAWFVSFGVAFAVYLVLTRGLRMRLRTQSPSK